MFQGAQVPDVKRTKPLWKADAACIFNLDKQRSASKNSQARMKQRGPAVSVPAILSLANFEQLHGRIHERIVRKVLLREWATV